MSLSLHGSRDSGHVPGSMRELSDNLLTSSPVGSELKRGSMTDQTLTTEQFRMIDEQVKLVTPGRGSGESISRPRRPSLRG